MKKGVLFILVLAAALSQIGMMSADLNVSMGPRYVNSSQSTLYNFTIQDTSSSGINFTQVNISVPSGFSIIGSTNGTNSISSLSISGSTLSWMNSPGIISAGNTKFFWFNTTNPGAIGQFNFTITSLDTSSNTNSTKINITLTDITPPSASFDDSVTPSNNSKLNRTYIPVKISASDNVGVDNVSIILFSGSGSILNASSVKSSPFSANFTGLSNGNYSFYATAWDASGNSNTLGLRYVTLNFTGSSDTATVTCKENWTCISWGQCDNATKRQACLVLSDTKNCGTNLTKPSDLTQECNPGCENWVCGDWTPSPCIQGQNQTMFCTDSNGCKPPENRTRLCQSINSSTASGSNAAGNTQNSSIPTAFIVVIIFVLGSIIAVVVILVKLKKKSYSPNSSDFGNEDELGRPKTY